MSVRPIRPRRSVLYVPADNQRAMQKSLQLKSDVIIYDLEDAILPAHKKRAREDLRIFFEQNFPKNGDWVTQKEILVRINGLDTDWGQEDLMAVRAMMPSGLCLPKVSDLDDVSNVSDALSEMDTPNDLRIWAMIETARGVLNAANIAKYARTPGTRLDCFMTGTNDLVKETKVSPLAGRPFISNWLSQVVLAARAYDLDVIDGVYNDFRDPEGLLRHCQDGKAMGFDGKSLIHPAQIEAANQIFGIDDDDLADAKAIIAEFSKAENADFGVIQLDGKMVERLHLDMAEKLVAKADLIANLEA